MNKTPRIVGACASGLGFEAWGMRIGKHLFQAEIERARRLREVAGLADIAVG